MKYRRMRLKIAIQKSGRLTDSSLDLLSRCGLKFSRGKDQLMCYGENMPLDVLFVRDDDIPDLVQEDVCDLGLVGLNVVEEKRLAFQARGLAPLFETVQLLDFGRCKLCIAVPDGFDYRARNRCRASASPPPIRTFWALSRRARHQSGGRGAVRRGRDRAAPRARGCDLRSGVHRIDAGGQSPAAGRSRAGKPGGIDPHAGAHPPEKQDWTRRLLMRIDGVEQVKGSKYIMLHAPRSALPAIAKLLPGSEAPTVIPLEGLGDRVAVHAVCRENVFWELLEDLKGAGASSVLVLPVEKMLA
jgi:ATP phosphoribosyltransferase